MYKCLLDQPAARPDPAQGVCLAARAGAWPVRGGAQRQGPGRGGQKCGPGKAWTLYGRPKASPSWPRAGPAVGAGRGSRRDRRARTGPRGEDLSEPVMATCGPGCGGVGRGAGRGSRRDRRARTGPRGDLSRFSALKCRSGPHGACAGDLAHAGEPAGRGLCELTRPVTRLGRRSQPRGQTVTQTARPSVPLPTSAATPMRARAKGLGVAGRPSPDPERTAGLDLASSPERLGSPWPRAGTQPPGLSRFG